MAWSKDPSLRGFFKGITNCLSALLAAGRYEEIVELLDMAPYDMGCYRQYGVMALAAMGRKAEAIGYEEESRGLNDSPVAIARACEEIPLSSGLVDEAYRRYGLVASRAGTHLAWFRAVARKYPHKKPAEVLEDLVELTPGKEGKWFAAAKSAKLFDEAVALANRAPCSPQALTRAARDFVRGNPAFALEAGLAALRWIVEGYGYEVTGLDVLDADTYTMRVPETGDRVRGLLAGDAPGRDFAAAALDRHIGPS